MQKFTLFFVVIFSALSINLQGQEETCSKLGAWVWHLEISGFENHQFLADSLVSLGVKRVYMKVADGGVNENSWPEVADVQLVNIYKTRDLEVYAWSYNYPGNEEAQAQALYRAAETGYQGYVVDVETEFDGDSQALNKLFGAFAQRKDSLLGNGIIDEDFDLYCTTWGNPKDHNFYISIIDPYVDGYLAQTYVEQWGPVYVENLEYWIAAGDAEYVEMGATKPVHHILAMQDGNVSAERANAFLQTAGPESSIWRVPGGSIDESVWETWDEIDWDHNFCDLTSSEELDVNSIRIYPNPVADQLQMELNDIGKTVEWKLYNSFGGLLKEGTIDSSRQLDLSELANGIYFLKTVEGSKSHIETLIKI